MSRPTATADAAAAAIEELRQLIREAHGATRDLAQLMREYRRAVADGTELAKKSAADAAQFELQRFGNHLQTEMNRHTASLNAAVQRAQEHVVSCLTMVELRPDGDVLKVKFEGTRFDSDVPMPYPEADPDLTCGTLTCEEHDRPGNPVGASCGHPANEDGECDCSSWPERAR